MAELTREKLDEKRVYYRNQMLLLEGAIAALDELEAELYPKDALTVEEFEQAIGARVDAVTAVAQ